MTAQQPTSNNELEEFKRLFLEEKHFPRGLFPQEIESYLEKKSKVNETDYGTMALMFLGLAATAMGGKKKVAMGTWVEKAILWVVMVGKSGLGKTSILKGAGLDQINVWQGKNIKERRKQMEVYESKLEKWENMTREQKGKERKPTEPDIAKQCFTNASTTEALLEMNDKITEGVSEVADELANILDSKGQYKNGGGNDQSVRLELWTGNNFTTNQCNKTRYLDDPFVCMVGGIQPELLKKIINVQNIADGYAARILHTFIQEPDTLLKHDQIREIENSITLKEQESIDQLFTWFLEGRENPKIYNFEREAESIIREYQYKLNVQARQADPYLYSPIRKLRTYVLRFALLLHVINGTGEYISEETALLTIMVIDYLKEGTEKAFHVVFQNDRSMRTALIVEKIRMMEGQATKENIRQKLKRVVPYKEGGIIIDQLIKEGIIEEKKYKKTKRVFLQVVKNIFTREREEVQIFD